MNVTFTQKDGYSEPVYSEEISSDWEQPEDKFKGMYTRTSVAGTIEDGGDTFTFSGDFINDCGFISWEDLRVYPVWGSDVDPVDMGFDDSLDVMNYFSDKYADGLADWV